MFCHYQVHAYKKRQHSYCILHIIPNYGDFQCTKFTIAGLSFTVNTNWQTATSNVTANLVTHTKEVQDHSCQKSQSTSVSNALVSMVCQQLPNLG